MALLVAPPADEQVGHHHDQRRALGKRLIHAEHERQHRNRDDAATDAEQAAEKAERGTERNQGKQVRHGVQQGRGHLATGGERIVHAIHLMNYYNGRNFNSF